MAPHDMFHGSSVRRPARWLAALAALMGLLGTRPAWAQDPGEVPSTATVTSPVTFGAGGRRPYWSGAKTNPFVSSTFEAGLVYFRPKLALGYGKPHWQFFGVEVQSQLTAGSFAEYAGLRAAFPDVDFRVGARYAFAPSQAYLARTETYTDDQLQFDEEPASRYLALEAEISGNVEVWNDGSLVATASAFQFLGVPDEYDVYDQNLNVVVQPPWAFRQRLGYLHAFGVDDGLQFGVSGELIEIPERDAVIVRVGPQLGVALTHHLDAALAIMIPVVSPDTLRLEGAQIGQFGFRYRWSSTDPFPEFP